MDVTTDAQIPEGDDEPTSETLDTYAGKITCAYNEVLASHERQVENHLAVAELLLEARAVIAHGNRKDENGNKVGGWKAFVETKLPFGDRKEQMYREIGEAFIEKPHDRAALCKVLPAHFTLLHALAKLDARYGEGTLAKALAAQTPTLIHAEMSMDDIEQVGHEFGTAPTEDDAPAQTAPRKPRARVQQRESDRAATEHEPTKPEWEHVITMGSKPAIEARWRKPEPFGIVAFASDPDGQLRLSEGQLRFFSADRRFGAVIKLNADGTIPLTHAGTWRVIAKLCRKPGRHEPEGFGLDKLDKTTLVVTSEPIASAAERDKSKSAEPPAAQPDDTDEETGPLGIFWDRASEGVTT